MSQSHCNNCGKQGHTYYQCKSPITSLGVIAFRTNPITSEYEYLMIRRKDTLGFIDFMRGKYSVHNKEYIVNMIRQMTNSEKDRILTQDFTTLWRNIWGKSACAMTEQYKTEEAKSKVKFELLRNGVATKYRDKSSTPRYDITHMYTLADLVHLANTGWNEPEWGFPKGRRNHQERDYDCAIREFCEETGYTSDRLVVLSNIVPFEEIFTGSNYKSYKHKYYIMYMQYDDKRDMPMHIPQMQESEVSALEWKTYEECLDSIRPYNKEKIRIIHDIHAMLNSTYHSIYSGNSLFSAVAGMEI